MIGWLLDTNVISEAARPKGDPNVVAWLNDQGEEDLYISVLTLAEFDKGIANPPAGSPARARIEVAVVAIERRFADRIVPLSDSIVRRWGRLSGSVQQAKGKPPPVIDALLAATAIEHDLCLVTRNVKDVRHTGAVLFDPWHDDPSALVVG